MAGDPRPQRRDAGVKRKTTCKKPKYISKTPAGLPFRPHRAVRTLPKRGWRHNATRTNKPAAIAASTVEYRGITTNLVLERSVTLTSKRVSTSSQSTVGIYIPWCIPGHMMDHVTGMRLPLQVGEHLFAGRRPARPMGLLPSKGRERKGTITGPSRSEHQSSSSSCSSNSSSCV